MNWDDITLLYKNIVVLPKDKITESPKETESTTTYGETDSDTKANNETPVAEETKPAYEKIRHPFVIFTKSSLKPLYQEENSSFQKIINALNITKASKYINSDPNSFKNISNFDCVWCIGLDIAVEKELRSINHTNVHFSPDILSLSNNEEKKAMFVPLKEFIGKNDTILEKL